MGNLEEVDRYKYLGLWFSKPVRLSIHEREDVKDSTLCQDDEQDLNEHNKSWHPSLEEQVSFPGFGWV